jgi:hypothetical protein
MHIKDFLIILVLPFIGYLAASFNNEYDKYVSTREKYFNEFLTKFYNAFREDTDMNIRYYMKLNYNYSLYYVPPYISYLLEHDMIDEINKILIVDYFYYMPSYKNIILNTMSRIINISDFLFFLIIVGFSLVIALFLVILFSLIGITNQQIEVTSLAILMGTVFTFIYLIKKIVKSINENNIYSCNESQIKKMISKKSEQYFELEEQLYFIKGKQSSNKTT